MCRARASTGSSGFTLLEMIVVVLLIGLVSAVALPRLGGGSRIHLRSAERAVSGELRLVGLKAMASGKDHRWVVDLDNQRMRVEVREDPADAPPFELPATPELLDLKPPGIGASEYAPLESKQLGEWHALDDADSGIEIDAVCIADVCEDTGVRAVRFAADGGADPAQVWLLDAPYDDHSRISVVGFTGEVRVESGVDE